MREDWDILGMKELFSQWCFFNGKLTGKEAKELWEQMSNLFQGTLNSQLQSVFEEIETKIEQHRLAINPTEENLKAVKSLRQKYCGGDKVNKITFDDEEIYDLKEEK